MFKSAQDYITVIITRDFVHTALISLTNKTAEVKSFSEVMLEEGIIEDGVVYRGDALADSIKDAISQLETKGRLKVWLAVPDNKVLISNSHSIEKLEKKYDVTLDELSILKSDNGLTAIKKDYINSYLNTVIKAGYEVQSVFPIASCVQSAIKSKIAGNTLVFYPFGTSKLKFFLVNDRGVLMNSVMGHNILDKDKNLEKGLKEIETFAISQGTVDAISKAISISNDENDEVGELLPNVEFEYIKKDQDEIDNVPFLVIKGLIKKASTQQKGFTIDDPDLKKPVVQSKSVKVVSTEPKREVKSNGGGSNGNGNNMKVGVIATVLTLLVLTLIGILVLALVNNKKQSSNSSDIATVSKIPTVTPTPTATAAPTPTATPTPTPTPVAQQLDQFSVAVLNGNGIAGDSQKVKQAILAKGFKNVQTNNASNFNYSTTEVLVKPNADQAGDTIVALLKDAYLYIAKKPAPAGQVSDIVVILGAK
jgi:hypothetical protein